MGHDHLAMGETRRLDGYQMGELEMSNTMQLDTVGMQPHSREYLERDMTGIVSARRLVNIDGQLIDHCDGIQFTGRP